MFCPLRKSYISGLINLPNKCFLLGDFMFIRNKKVMVDSTYLLPLVGVRVADLPENPLSSLIDLGFNVKINEISLFEAVGKAMREVVRAANRESAVKTVEVGVKSLLLDEGIEKLPICELYTVSSALKLYEGGLHDLPDCFIAASASVHTGLLLTESDDVKCIVKKVNIPLKIFKWREFTSNI